MQAWEKQAISTFSYAGVSSRVSPKSELIVTK